MNFELTLAYSAADLEYLAALPEDGHALVHARVVGAALPGESEASLRPGLRSGDLVELTSAITANRYWVLMDGPFIAELRCPLRYVVRTVGEAGLVVREAGPIVLTAIEAARRRVRGRYALEPGQNARGATI